MDVGTSAIAERVSGAIDNFPCLKIDHLIKKDWHYKIELAFLN